MNPELIGIPFDHFQRYGAASSLVDAIGGARVERILEVGANRQRILKTFLPNAHFVFSDLEPQEPVNADGDAFVQADATQLPFADREFDAVVSLDVMEHIPPELRAMATSEMARVAKRVVIIGCPLDHPWVHDAEQKANAVWEAYFGEAYPWLEEHKEFGLVDPSIVEGALVEAGFHTLRFGQGDVDVWAGMMGSHFIKEAVPELAGVVGAVDRLYNASVFAGDRTPRAYREFFVAVRGADDFARLKASAFLNEKSDDAVKLMLSGLADDMRPVVNRLLTAEREWSNTARTARDFETQLVSSNEAREALAAQKDHLATAHAEQGVALSNAEDALARADARALELAVSAGRLTAVADSLRVHADELKLELGKESRQKEIFAQRVLVLERRQRLLAYGAILAAAFAVGAAVMYRFMA